MSKYIHDCIKFFMNRNKHILEFDEKMYNEECPICFEIFGEFDDILYIKMRS